jgi:ABC-type transport system involved in cytochrome c biogenesis permease subunit
MAVTEHMMPTRTLPASTKLSSRVDQGTVSKLDSVDITLHGILMRLASLRLTVTLLVMAVFLVLVGTLAQVDEDVWQVVDGYFRAPLAWIDLRVFFPPSFFPGWTVPYEAHLPGGYLIPLGFYFPGGWLIGGLMAINLLAALAVRFPVQARGLRRHAGWGLVGLGCLLTWVVVFGDATTDVGQSTAWISKDVTWRLLQAGLAAACLLLGTAAWRLKPGRSLERGVSLAGAVLLGGLLTWTLCGNDAARLGDSSLRILSQMFRGQLATLVLLVGCLLLYNKKAGLVLLHGGLGLLMFGELLTGLTAVEGHIQMVEGQSADFVRHSRSLELAIIDHSGPDRDVVVSVPESRLLSGRRIQDESLPFDIQLVQYLKNSVVRQAQPKDANPATAGLGLEWLAEPTRPAAGTDGGRTNISAAYVNLLDKQTSASLGTHLVGLAFSEDGLLDEIEANGKTYEIALRQRRTYKPYTMTLIDVEKEDYPGTDIPKHYASLVQLVDESRHVDRTIKIWMNNPLRFAGETFYQSGYYRDPETGAEASTLTVVNNTGWMIPYVGCMVVATGLLTQFALVLGRYLRRRSEVFSAAAEPTCPPARPFRLPLLGRAPLKIGLVVPAIVLASGVWLLPKAFPPGPASRGFDLYGFGKLPVTDHGRIKPVDSLARTSLQVLSGRQTFLDPQGTRQPAIRWFLDLITRPETAAEFRVFRIEHPEVLGTLGLEAREGFRYAPAEFVGKLDTFKRQVSQAGELESSKLSNYQRKLLELDRKLALWETLIQAYIPQAKRPPAWNRAMGMGQVSSGQLLPLSVPSNSEEGGWQTYARAADINPGQRQAASAADTIAARSTSAMGAILAAYAAGDTVTFNREVARFPDLLRDVRSAGLDPVKIHYESFFNYFEPCYHATVLYFVAFVLAAVAWLGWSGPLNRASFGLLVTVFGLHSFVLLSRIYISGRPPVTNLYSSAVFIGWAGVLFGLGLELLYCMGVGNVIASVTGFASLLIAHFLGSDGDTFAVLQAVLDTQFWLATHVVCITLGYSATYVAGLLGVLFLVRGVLTRSLTPSRSHELSRMIYGTLCFAILFSFVGTVLGGLWADDSWGRFWGWDPKENGALIIVLWNAMVLHARRGGLIKERGLAILAVAGNIAVSWSWFGVNELGIGLHSYGFTEGALKALGLFVVSQLAIIVLGLLPESLWMSRRHPPGAAVTT